MGKPVKQTIGPSDGWVKATSGEDKGTLFHIRGGLLSITQSDTQPDNSAVPMGEIGSESKNFLYFGLGINTEYLYVKAKTSGVAFSITSAIE
jgi:hypothetical protein